MQKRNHCRLFHQTANHAVENALPGTVVDNVITTASQFDFYMCSHYVRRMLWSSMMPRLSDQLLICCSHVRTPRVGQGLLGTSRPTHYHVLNDDIKLSADEIQRFTFDLCHLCAATPRASMQ